MVPGKQQREQRHVFGMDVAKFSCTGLWGRETECAGEIWHCHQQRGDCGGGQTVGE